MVAVLFTAKSRNLKTGPIAVTTSSAETCPRDCPLKGAGCYGENGPLGGLWRGLTKAGPNSAFPNGRSMVRSLDWAGLLERVRGLAEGVLWRHNQAGDLPHHHGVIDRRKVRQLTEANRGRRGWTYSHHNMHNANNRHTVREANANGFVINLSADTAAEADELAALDIGPVVVTMPEDESQWFAFTPDNRRVVPCPAVTHDGVRCVDCGLCAVRDRQVVIGFPGHGVRAEMVGRLV